MPIWRSLIRFGFRLLYNELAWSYDFVSRLVSQGQWRRWQRAAIPFLRGPRVLELALGTGDLLLDLMERDYLAAGIDLSPAMVRIAARKLRRAGRPLHIVRACAQALPFEGANFDAVVSTFPTPFILDPNTRVEVWRVLAPSGRWIIVDQSRLSGSDLWSRVLNWAYRVTGQRDRRDLSEALASGFTWHLEEQQSEKSAVRVWVGTKK